MEQHIVSAKLLVHILIYASLCLLVLTIYQYLWFKPHIMACNETSGTVYIINISQTKEIVIPSSSLKDTLSCMGRSLLFYDRVVSVLFDNHVSEESILGFTQRYHVEDIVRDHGVYEDIEIKYINDRIVLTYKGFLYILYIKSPQSPFELVRTDKNNDYALVIGPELEQQVSSMVDANTDVEFIPYTSVKQGHQRVFVFDFEQVQSAE